MLMRSNTFLPYPLSLFGTQLLGKFTSLCLGRITQNFHRNSLPSLQKQPRVNAQSFTKLAGVLLTDSTLAAFHFGNVMTGNAAHVGKLLLRQIFAVTSAAQKRSGAALRKDRGRVYKFLKGAALANQILLDGFSMIHRADHAENVSLDTGRAGRAREVLPKIRTAVIATQPDEETTDVQTKESCPGV